jgi:hypothetical protein
LQFDEIFFEKRDQLAKAGVAHREIKRRADHAGVDGAVSQ